MLGLAGVVNVIWGIAAIDNSSFFTDEGATCSDRFGQFKPRPPSPSSRVIMGEVTKPRRERMAAMREAA